MGGWSSAESRIKNLGKKSLAVEQGNRVSVVYYDSKTGVIDWPLNPAAGVLVVPRLMTEAEWAEWDAE